MVQEALGRGEVVKEEGGALAQQVGCDVGVGEVAARADRATVPWGMAFHGE